MMRTVFLLFAEERGLLPSGELFDQGYGISQRARPPRQPKATRARRRSTATSLTWHRLLATSQALFGGASFESLRMPAYGGSLFDPARFPFLTATTEHGGLCDRRVRPGDAARAPIGADRNGQGRARQISFRDVDVEQIGYIYEGLLGYTCTTVDQTVPRVDRHHRRRTRDPSAEARRARRAAHRPKAARQSDP
jgi:hypothetical protein